MWRGASERLLACQSQAPLFLFTLACCVCRCCCWRARSPAATTAMPPLHSHLGDDAPVPMPAAAQDQRRMANLEASLQRQRIVEAMEQLQVRGGGVLQQGRAKRGAPQLKRASRAGRGTNVLPACACKHFPACLQSLTTTHSRAAAACIHPADEEELGPAGRRQQHQRGLAAAQVTQCRRDQT